MTHKCYYLPDNLLEYLSSFQINEKSLEYSVCVTQNSLKVSLNWTHEGRTSRQMKLLNLRPTMQRHVPISTGNNTLSCSKSGPGKPAVNSSVEKCSNPALPPRSFHSTHSIVLAKQVGLHTQLDRATVISGASANTWYARASLEDDVTQHHVTMDHAKLLSHDELSTIEADSDRESMFSVSSLDSVVTDDNAVYDKTMDRPPKQLGSTNDVKSMTTNGEDPTRQNQLEPDKTGSDQPNNLTLCYSINKRPLSPIHERCDHQTMTNEKPTNSIGVSKDTRQHKHPHKVKLSILEDQELLQLFERSPEDILVVRASKFRLQFQQLKNLIFDSGIIHADDVTAVMYDESVMSRPGYLIQIHPTKRSIIDKLLDKVSEERNYGVLKLAEGDEIRMTSFDCSLVEKWST